jgi:ATP:ADP antiporter, AAA family
MGESTAREGLIPVEQVEALPKRDIGWGGAQRTSAKSGSHTTGGSPGKSILERILAVVTEVRPGEGPTALLLTVNIFLLLTAYSCIKPVREALILARQGGAEYKAYMGAATAAVLLLVIPIYSSLGSRFARNKVIVGVTLFFALNLVGFYVAGVMFGSTLWLALGFYLWIAVFNMMIVAQFWAFANDIYTVEAGYRLFPLVGLGASVGAVVGASVAKVLISLIGTLPMMAVAGGLLAVSAGISEWIHRRELARTVETSSREVVTKGLGGSFFDAFKLVFAQRYLLLVAIFSLVFTLVKTNGDFVLAHLISDAAHAAVAAGTLAQDKMGDYIGGFYANYLLWVNVGGLVLQAFLVSRLVRYLGFPAAFFVLPILALTSGVLILIWPVVATVTPCKIVESSVDYSVNNTVRSMLWLPTSRRAKYLAKQAVDTFFVRMGDVASAGLVFAGSQWMAWPLRAFVACNVGLVAAWLLMARAIVREKNRIRNALIEQPDRATDQGP